MKTTNNTKVNFIPILFTGLLVLFFASCGTHSDNDYSDRDGIYSNDKEVTVTETTKEDKDSYYKQYFKTKELAYKDVPDDNAIFTDIDEYYTTETVDEDGYIVTEEREIEEEYGAWGSNSGEVTINIYGGYSYGYWHRPHWWYGSYWGYPYYYGYGWGYPYYWGGYWGGHWGWGYPYYGHWYGYPTHYYGHGYNGTIAYNRGRRNTSYANSRYASRGRSAVNTGRGSYSRLESDRRNSINTNSSRRNTVSRNGNTVSNRRNSVNSTTRPYNNNNNLNNRSNTVRRSTNSRSNNFNNRSSNSRRSSGSYRSSGSSRSSGSMRSGGGSSRGSSSGSRRGGRG